jgi:hypothetical protein
MLLSLSGTGLNLCHILFGSLTFESSKIDLSRLAV